MQETLSRGSRVTGSGALPYKQRDIIGVHVEEAGRRGAVPYKENSILSLSRHMATAPSSDGARFFILQGEAGVKKGHLGGVLFIILKVPLKYLRMMRSSILRFLLAHRVGGKRTSFLCQLFQLRMRRGRTLLLGIFQVQQP